MSRKLALAISLTVVLTCMLGVAIRVQRVEASGTINIRADGSVDPPTAPISSVDNVTYIFTYNINDSIVVERDNIVVDGAGYTVQGTGSGTGISLSGRSNVTIRNMEIKAFRYGIRLWLSSNNTFSGNNITANFWSGILLDKSSNNAFSGNNIAANNGEGILLEESSNHNSISGNNITANNGEGIYLELSSNNTFSGNNIAANNGEGISLWLSSNNAFSGNNIAANNGDGILLEESSNNAFSGNNITANFWSGILLDKSSNNAIYHNNFVDNTEQVDSYASTNAWDNGYLSGGNYWSDHVCTGNPSDGSQPHIIDENNIDHYPFQDPNGWLPLPPEYTLTIYSSPTEVTFTVDGVSHTAPLSGNYIENALVSLIMPEIHSVRDARYYWNQWSDGNTSRSRTVTMNTNVALTANYTGPYYQLTVTSLPITGITFTIDGVPQTTPYTKWVLEGSYTLEMPENYDGYVWYHWLEEDINRIKTVTMDTDTLLTAVFAPPDTTPPTISVLSPENKTYLVEDVPLIFTVSESTSWISYSLNSQMNVTISGNTTIVDLSDGTHTITVYANDTAGNMGSSDLVYFTLDITPPSISIMSPENKTYDTTDISLTFTVDESVLWMAHSLDGQINMTITENTTLSELSDGSHSLIVYAYDAAGNTGASEIIYFNIETQQPEPQPEPESAVPWQLWIIAIKVVIAVVGTALLVYFLKKRKPRVNPPLPSEGTDSDALT